MEAVAEALHRVGGAEEVAAVADLEMCVEGETRLVDLERRERSPQRAENVEVDDQFLEGNFNFAIPDPGKCLYVGYFLDRGVLQ